MFLTDTQIRNLHDFKTFADDSVTNIKLSKTQISKVFQSFNSSNFKPEVDELDTGILNTVPVDLIKLS